jgi:hypothetical protein
MAGQTPTNTSSGIAFLVSSGIVYEIVAAACSSPQTTEINASTRADTLMKWVHLGLAQAVVFVVAAAMIDRKHAAPILTGGALAGAILYVSYAHARAAGLASDEEGTES